MIDLKNISKSFAGKPILKNMNLSIKKGETVCIVGSSGQGKSVTLGHITGNIIPDEGDVFIFGENIVGAKKIQHQRIIKKFGVLFQSSALIAWLTVEENIALPLVENYKLSKTKINIHVKKAISRVHLEGSEKKYPSEISGGMQKRVGLARAIIMQPEILLYDEPTSGLDPIMSRRIDSLIIYMQKKLHVTSVVVTHDLYSAMRISDKIAFLYDKKFDFIGSPAEFMNSNKKYIKDFIRAQFPKNNNLIFNKNGMKI